MRLSLFFHQLLALGASLGLGEACMRYKATVPFDADRPFEASITDNGVVTCWLSMSYNEHKKLDASTASPVVEKKKVQRRSVGHAIELTERPPLSDNPDAMFNLEKEETWRKPDQMVSRSQEIILKADEPDNPRFGKWNFECLKEGEYKAFANVGARTIKYYAHGQDFFFVPEQKEHIINEEWEYEIALWCKPQKGERNYKPPTGPSTPSPSSPPKSISPPPQPKSDSPSPPLGSA